MLRNLCGLLFTTLMLCGCASKTYVVLLESPDGTTGAVVVKEGKKETLINQKQQGLALGRSGFFSKPFNIGQARIDRDFSAALHAQPALPQRFQLYFQIGSAELTTESRLDIDRVIDAIRVRGPSAVSVIGHTDTLSGPRWNAQLGLIRARAIADLIRRHAIDVIDLSVSSHGERNLLIKTPDGVSEPRNRRVEVSVR